MTYIELINYFWMKDLEKKFSLIETRLYFILLNYANKFRWKRSVSLSNNRLINEIGCSLTGLCKARKDLINRGFISYKKGNQFSAGTYTVHRQFACSSIGSLYEDHYTEQKESELPLSSPLEACTTLGVNREEKHMESMMQNNMSIYKKNNKQSMEQSNIYKTRQDKDKKRQEEDEEEKMKKEEDRFHLLPHRRIIELYNEICVDLPSFDEQNIGYLESDLHKRNRNLGTEQSWREFFTRVDDSDFLCNRIPEKSFNCSLYWLLQDENFTKIMIGNYDVNYEYGSDDVYLPTKGTY